jgi:hypothetical protein
MGTPPHSAQVIFERISDMSSFTDIIQKILQVIGYLFALGYVVFILIYFLIPVGMFFNGFIIQPFLKFFKKLKTPFSEELTYLKGENQRLKLLASEQYSTIEALNKQKSDQSSLLALAQSEFENVVLSLTSREALFPLSYDDAIKICHSHKSSERFFRALLQDVSILEFTAKKNSNGKFIVSASTKSSSGKDIYKTTLKSCSCIDFSHHKKPCKHMYLLALTLGVISSSDFESFRKEAPLFPKLSKKPTAKTKV